MLKAGIQTALSCIWKSAVPGSKLNQMPSDSRNVATEVSSATLRVLRATTSGWPRMATIKAAPSSGRNVTSERTGKLANVGASTGHAKQIPGDENQHADQHGEGVVEDVAGLQPYRAAGDPHGGGGDAVGPDPVDQRPVPTLPQAPPESERRPHEDGVVELVEVPLVQQEPVDRLEALGQQAGQVGRRDVQNVRERDAGEAHDQRQELHPQRNLVGVLERRMPRQHEDR